jgi:hypothetical protein
MFVGQEFQVVLGPRRPRLVIDPGVGLPTRVAASRDRTGSGWRHTQWDSTPNALLSHTDDCCHGRNCLATADGRNVGAGV